MNVDLTVLDDLRALTGALRVRERDHARDVAKLSKTLGDLRGRVQYAIACLECADADLDNGLDSSAAREIDYALKALREALEVGP